MKITYYAHSAFLIEAQDGTRIIIDPYRSGSFGGALGYAPVGEPADAVIATHAHEDHAAVDTIPGRPMVLLEPSSARVGPVDVTGFTASHDASGGRERGRITMVMLEDAGVRLLHAGDLGHMPDQATRDALGRVDILLVPVGGTFTLGPAEAARVVAALGPRIVIPMHYKTAGTTFPLVDVEEFLATQPAVERPGGSTVDLTAAALPAETTVILLERSR